MECYCESSKRARQSRGILRQKNCIPIKVGVKGINPDRMNLILPHETFENNKKS